MHPPTAEGPLWQYGYSTALGLRCSSAGTFVCRPARESGGSGGGGERGCSSQVLPSFVPAMSCMSERFHLHHVELLFPGQRGTATCWCFSPGAVCAWGPDVSSSGGCWVLAQEWVSVHHPRVFPGAIRDVAGSERGVERLHCGRELVGCTGSHPPALPAWGHGASPLPHRTESWAEGVTRVAACPCFASLCHVSWAWGVPCMMSFLPPTLLLSDPLSAGPFPSRFPAHGDAATGALGCSGCPRRGLSGHRT